MARRAPGGAGRACSRPGWRRPPDGDPGRLVEAMRYSLLAPGKRIRPLLALAAAEAVGAPLR